MPSPDSALRAFYLGENEPAMMLENVFRFCLYADQIVLVNPFDNPPALSDGPEGRIVASSLRDVTGSMSPLLPT
jgi:hypothetical protein